MVNVRNFEVTDAQPASKILCNAFRSFLGNKFDKNLVVHFSPEELVKVINSKGKFHESKIFIAEEDGKVIGVVKVTAGTNGLGLLDYIGVDPECPVHGVGTLLMKKAEEFWEKNNQRKIDTCVSAHNTKALIYYIKNGFVPEGYRKDPFHKGMDEIILGRFLNK